MAKNSLFRNSVGGYNKADVTAYIENLNIEFEKKIDEYEGEIRVLKQQIEEGQAVSAKEIADLNQAIAAQGEVISGKDGEIAVLAAEKADLEARILVLEADVARLTEETEAQKSQITSLTLEAERAVKTLEEEREAMAERLQAEESEFAAHVEETLEQIQTEAEMILKRANETAEVIIANAKKKAAGVASAITSHRSADSSYAPRRTGTKTGGVSEIIKSHKSKMEAFFSALTDSLKGDDK